MANMRSKGTPLGYAGDRRVPFAWAGWNDALAGHPFNYYLVDRAPNPACAHAYEIARYCVMALRDAKLTVPQWHSLESVPPAIHAAFAISSSFNDMGRAEGKCYWPTGPDHWRAAA